MLVLSLCECRQVRVIKVFAILDSSAGSSVKTMHLQAGAGSKLSTVVSSYHEHPTRQRRRSSARHDVAVAAAATVVPAHGPLARLGAADLPQQLSSGGFAVATSPAGSGVHRRTGSSADEQAAGVHETARIIVKL